MTIMTPAKLRLLCGVASYRILSQPQAVRLQGASEKSVQRALRDLFDAGLVDIVAVPRAALAGPHDVNAAALAYGSAPNIYTPSRKGLKLLQEHGLIAGGRPAPPYGPQNSLFLRHELAVRDVRLWLELAARTQPGQALRAWHDGPEAALDLGRTGAPKTLRPDAWFVYRVGRRDGRDAVLVGLVEVDRGTERGDRRWQEKLAGYEALFAGGRLQEATGYVNARVLVITPDQARRERLAALLHRNAAPAIQARFWLAERAVLESLTLGQSCWQRPGSQMLRPLVTADLLARPR